MSLNESSVGISNTVCSRKSSCQHFPTPHSTFSSSRAPCAWRSTLRAGRHSALHLPYPQQSPSLWTWPPEHLICQSSLSPVHTHSHRLTAGEPSPGGVNSLLTGPTVSIPPTPLPRQHRSDCSAGLITSLPFCRSVVGFSHRRDKCQSVACPAMSGFSNSGPFLPCRLQSDLNPPTH